MYQFWKFGKKIVAVGRNYVDHAKELGNAIPKKPVIFLKPTSSYVRRGNPIEIPPSVKELHHEVELGVIIGSKGRDISVNDAMKFVAGYVVALDMTARDIQDEAKKAGLPWTEAKGYDTFCGIGEYIPKHWITNPDNVELWLRVDGELKQQGNTKDMIFKIPFLINYISSIMTLEPGDLILTGTPKGVGPVTAGQMITAGITGITEVQFQVVARKPKL
jgi:acylpyruvate hydrolase